jgi:ATP-dependent Clp protease adaptor protein ClpS
MPGRSIVEPLVSPSIIRDIQEAGEYVVVIFNNDVNSFDQVIAVLMHATECDLQEASLEAWEAHTFGAAKVHHAPQHECRHVARIISAIGVLTEVRREDDV